MIKSFQNNDSDKVLLYGIIFAFVKLFHFIFGRTIILSNITLFNKIRACLINIVYQKVLDLNKASLGKLHLGKLKNIISNNFSSLELKFINISFLLASPFSMIYAMILLWVHLEFMSLFALLIMGFIFGLQTFLNKKNQKIIEEKNHFTDERIQKTNEFIQNIKTIKIYGWNKTRQKLIEKIREKELKKSFIQNLFVMCDVALSNSSSSLIISIIYLFSYFILGKSETFFAAWSIISVYQIIEFARLFQFLLPSIGLNILYETKTILSRIIEVISIKNENPLSEHFVSQPNNENVKLQLINFSAYYLDANLNEKAILKNITYEFESGKAYLIKGRVGSGKSSFFHSILGQLPKYQGKIYISNSISYTEQEPFLFSDTIRENILFFLPYNESHYQNILKACCLEEDLLNLPDGDLTQISDNGMKLSGGQKIRVSLARALYRNGEIYLLDDPFSGLDNVVARQIFDNIMKILTEKCVIIITHHKTFDKMMHCSLTLRDGQFFEGLIETDENVKENIIDDQKENKEPIKENIEFFDDENVMDLIPKYDRVNSDTYKKYFSLSNSFGFLIFCLVFFASSDILKFYLTKLLSIFDSNYQIEEGLILLISLTLIMFAFNFLKYFTFIKFLVGCNDKLHEKIINSVSNANSIFFDTHSAASIINTFSNDVGIFDTIFIYVAIDAFETVFNFIFSLGVFCYLNKWFTIPSVILVTFFFWFVFRWKKIILAVKLLDLENKNPLYGCLDVSYRGKTSIDAYERKSFFEEYFDKIILNSAKSNLNYWECMRGMNLATDCATSSLYILGNL